VKRPIRPRWLLRLANDLAPEQVGVGQPRNTNLRRAISTAYYGLFHAITLATAENALPGAGEGERNAFTRHAAHTGIREVCGWINGAAPPQAVEETVKRLRQNARISDVTATFVALHQAREDADYNHDAEITRTTTRSLIERAEKAVAVVETDAAADDFRSFLGLLSLKMTLRRG
jgi:uncharacterized protein (UPF0332 family)